MAVVGNRRFTWPIVGVAVAIAAVTSVPVDGQGGRQPTRKPVSQDAKTSTVPRTPWGHPDLQGPWSNATTTPL